MAGVLYDRIGATYSATRRPDPRIAALIEEGLGDSVTVVNVGAGTGAYEPAGRRVVAIEPSETMIRQRPRRAAPAIVAHAESLPLADASVDAALAVLTVHHWADPAQGLRELRRVARGPVVVFTCDPEFAGEFWLSEYLPSLIDVDLPRLPRLSVYREALGSLRIRPVPVPHDCTDGFLASYWRRPERYLDEHARANISTFTILPPDEIEAGISQLAEDLSTGAWHERYASLLGLDELDVGYCLLVAEPAA